MPGKPSPAVRSEYIQLGVKYGIPLALLVLLLVFFGGKIAAALSPFLVAIVLAYILDPVVLFIQDGRFRLGRLGSVIILYLILLLIIGLLFTMIIPRLVAELSDLSNRVTQNYFPKIVEQAQHLVERYRPHVVHGIGLLRSPETPPGEPLPAPPVIDSASPEITSATEEMRMENLFRQIQNPIIREKLMEAARQGWNVLSYLVDKITAFVLALLEAAHGFLVSLTQFGIALVILFYILIDFPKLKSNLLLLIPRRNSGEWLRILGLIDEQLSAYLRGQVTVCFCVGLLVTVGLTLIGFIFGLQVAKYSLLIGLCAGVFNFVPYLGPIMGATPAVVLTLIDTYQPGQPGMVSNMILQVGTVASLFVFVQLADGLFLSPRIMGEKLDLHPMIIMFALLLGGGIAGFVGMLLAVPMACIIRTLVTEIYLKDLLVESEPTRPPVPPDPPK